jgi:hypothetical protein
MSRICPNCGTDAGEFVRCPNCAADLSPQAAEPAATGGDAPFAPDMQGGGGWDKTTVVESPPNFETGKRARFDQSREFYTPIDESRAPRSASAGFGQTTIDAGGGDKTIVDRGGGRTAPAEDATVIVRRGKRGVTGPLAYLVERNGVRAGKVHLLGADTSIGRGSDNDIVLGNDSVSRHHAKIKAEEGAFVYWDLASANHSYVTSPGGTRARVLEPRQLVDKDLVDLGEAKLAFLLVDPDGSEDDEA